MTALLTPAPMPDFIEQYFDTYAGYQQAILATLARTRSTICILDTDLSESGLESMAGIAALKQLARTSFHHQAIRVLIQKEDHLERYCPRLRLFFSMYSHRASIRILCSETPAPERIFLVADNIGLLIRRQLSKPNGKCYIGRSAKAKQYLFLFNAAWETGTAGAQGTTLGL